MGDGCEFPRCSRRGPSEEHLRDSTAHTSSTCTILLYCRNVPVVEKRCDQTRKHWRRPEHVTPRRTVYRNRRSRPKRAAYRTAAPRSCRRRRSGRQPWSAGSSTNPLAGNTWPPSSVSLFSSGRNDNIGNKYYIIL